MRRATYVLYAFFRVADEVVDDSGPTPVDARYHRLEVIRQVVLGERDTDHPVLAAFRDLRMQAAIPRYEVEVFLDAMADDLERNRYETRADLEAYMRGSSTAVAFMMLAVMNPDDEGIARPHARALGEAFQLTNFLRDVREDCLERDRIYLPEAVLQSHGSSHEELERLEPTDGIRAAVADELERTEQLYRVGVAGIQSLPRECQFPVLLAAVLYAEHHRLIRDSGFDVVSNPLSLSTRRKVWLCLSTARRWMTERDPETVFFDVSAVSRYPSAHHLTHSEVTDSDRSASESTRDRRACLDAPLETIKRTLIALLPMK